ncbi:Major sperm protein (MSP) domain [Dillenia turbinata]|uniref:Major sperm protein (MSP) domain n=1 Tax=Dillenia turbinata TaxID=194707 RepID=A0AAN8ZHC0_9MAGN
MAVFDPNHHHKLSTEVKPWRLCPFWQSGTSTLSSSSSTRNRSSSNTMLFVAGSLLPRRRRLRLDPANNLYFPYEPGKQFQTTAPKSCYMRPPGGILAPGESLVATVFKFVEQPENNEKLFDKKSKVKFKIMSLKVKEGLEYVPELFDEQKDMVAVEQILRVVFLDVERPSPALEKLKRQLAEAEAAVETRKKPQTDTGPKVIGEGLVIDEWKERREKYLARQQVEAVDSILGTSSLGDLSSQEL